MAELSPQRQRDGVQLHPQRHRIVCRMTAMKSKDDLVTHLVAKYSMEKGQAQRDAEAFLRGRKF